MAVFYIEVWIVQFWKALHLEAYKINTDIHRSVQCMFHPTREISVNLL